MTDPVTPDAPMTCPTDPLGPNGEAHTIIGCGSTNVAQDPDEPEVWDCLNCGIWFNPAEERRAGRVKVTWPADTAGFTAADARAAALRLVEASEERPR